jgi:hypothetical protein
MFGSFLPSLWSLNNHSLLGSRSRHCYAIKLDLRIERAVSPAPNTYPPKLLTGEAKVAILRAKFTAFYTLGRGHPAEPNAIVRCARFSILADSTRLFGYVKTNQYSYPLQNPLHAQKILGKSEFGKNRKPRQVNKKEW